LFVGIPVLLFSKMASEREQEEDYDRPCKIPRTLKEKDSGKRLIVIIEKASLETVKVRIFSGQNLDF